MHTHIHISTWRESADRFGTKPGLLSSLFTPYSTFSLRVRRGSSEMNCRIRCLCLSDSMILTPASEWRNRASKLLGSRLTSVQSHPC